jgi:hypothetical protein
VWYCCGRTFRRRGDRTSHRKGPRCNLNTTST